MTEDDPYDQLPAEPDLAFIRLEQFFRKKLDEKLDQIESNDGASHYYIDYINSVIAAATALDLGILNNWSVPGFQDAYSTYVSFSLEVSNYIIQIRVRHSRRFQTYSTHLDGADKIKIRHHLEKIKLIIENSDISDAKRESIYKKISALMLEIDKDRTGFEKFAGLVSDIARASSDFERVGAEPWWKWIKPIFEILGASMEKEANFKSLPKYEERKKLEAPKHTATNNPLDDEIPF